MSGRVGVCSWSLQAGSPGELVERVRATGCDAVQLALEPIRCGNWDEDATFHALSEAGIAVLSGMMETKGEDYSSIDAIMETGGIRPDGVWAENLGRARAVAAIAARRGIELVTFHAGYLPHDAGDPERAKLIDRLGQVAQVFRDAGVRLGLETGQESAETLVGVLDELGDDWVGVNFDPANMLLYGTGAPVPALELLADRVVQVHIKDAIASGTPGTWGEEVPAGSGEVNWDGFFRAVAEGAAGVDLVIEREAGDDRVGDVRTARELIAAKRDAY